MARSQFWNVCRYIQSPFQGRDLEGVLGGVCEAVAKQLHTFAVFSEQETKGHANPRGN